MAQALSLFPARIRFTNADGTLTAEAYRALQGLLERVGGPLGDNGVDVFGVFSESGAGDALAEMIFQPTQDAPAIKTVAISSQLGGQVRTIVVAASGTVQTLPAASNSQVGDEYTVILATAGFVDVTRSGADTINLPVADTAIRLNQKGASVTLRCLTNSSWGIV